MKREIQITYDLADPAGILFFANTFTLAHKNIEHLAKEIWQVWNEWFNNKEMGVPLRHAECDYLIPMKVGLKYTLLLKVEKISQHSVTFITEFLGESHNLHAKVKTTHVFIDTQKMQKIAVPKKIHAALSRL